VLTAGGLCDRGIVGPDAVGADEGQNLGPVHGQTSRSSELAEDEQLASGGATVVIEQPSK
jgi:hypothetical protein